MCMANASLVNVNALGVRIAIEVATVVSDAGVGGILMYAYMFSE